MSLNFSKAEIAAQNVLNAFGFDDIRKTAIADLIMARGAFYKERNCDGKDGEIVSYGGQSTITINSNILNEGRKRFTAAHELGHFELHRGLIPFSFDTEEDLIHWYQAGPHEVEANEFASELLMPSESFVRLCKGKILSPSVIEGLANFYKVSKTAAILKYVKRGNYPVFVVCCKNNRVKWFKRSIDFPYYANIQYGLPPPETSVAFELFTTNTLYSGDELKQGIYKSDWFNIRERERDIPMYEYCIFSRHAGVAVSIIWQD